MGCQIFFVLSSFKLCLSYEKKALSYWSFLLKRLKRVLFPWLLALVVWVGASAASVAVTGHNHINNSISPLDIVANILLVHGFIPSAINSVVLGGWFIGTLFILYLLFLPLLRIYNLLKKRIGIVTNYVFPLSIFFTSFCIVLILKSFFPNLDIGNNSFVYFSFVNQLPCFCIGIVLWDMNYRKTGKKTLFFITGLSFFGLALFLFYFKTKYSYIIMPFIFSISFCFSFLGLSFFNWDLALWKCLKKPGEMSLSIYLTHVLIVWYLTDFIKPRLIGIFSNEYFLFFIISFIAFPIVFIVALLFDLITGRFSHVFLKGIKNAG